MNKQYLKIGLVTLMTSIYSSGALAAGGAIGTASAKVIAPLTIAEHVTTKLNFGDFAVGTVGGNVTISDAGVRTADADIDLLTVGATTTPSQGQFTIGGETTMAITVVVDMTAAVLDDGLGNTMGISANPADAPLPTALVAGAATVNVGGILSVAGSQPAGSYSTTAGTPYTITVNYQ